MWNFSCKNLSKVWSKSAKPNWEATRAPRATSPRCSRPAASACCRTGRTRMPRPARVQWFERRAPYPLCAMSTGPRPSHAAPAHRPHRAARAPPLANGRRTPPPTPRRIPAIPRPYHDGIALVRKEALPTASRPVIKGRRRPSSRDPELAVVHHGCPSVIVLLRSTLVPPKHA
jgi:hypothetical protein